MRNEADESDVQIPEIYCSVSIKLNENINRNQMLDELLQLGIQKVKFIAPKMELCTYFEIAVVRNERFWYLDEALTKMFGQIDTKLQDLKKMVDKYGGSFGIDIAFYQYGTYPALEFVGENMRKIRFLEADISIDPY